MEQKTEEEGFEPPVRFPVQRFSRPPVSTTHPFLRFREYYLRRWEFQVLDSEILFPVGFSRGEFHGWGNRIGMSYRNRSKVGPAPERHEIAALGLHIELLSTPKSDLQQKRFAPLVRTKFDARNRLQRHLAVKVFLAVHEDG